MNERIRALAEQARAWVNDPDNVAPDIEYVFYKDAYDKKFAQLIVLECADVVSNQYSADWGKWSNRMILEHFGVEE